MSILIRERNPFIDEVNVFLQIHLSVVYCKVPLLGLKKKRGLSLYYVYFERQSILQCCVFPIRAMSSEENLEVIS